MAAEGAEISVKSGNNNAGNGNGNGDPVDRLHAVGPARPLPGGHAGAAGGAAARRRHRFRVRRARDLRPLPGRRLRGRVRQARRHLQGRSSLRLLAGRAALCRQARHEAGPAPVLPGGAAGRPRHRRAGGQPGPQAGGAQARRDARDRDRSDREAALCRGRRARHARPDRRSAAPGEGAEGAMGPDRPRRPTCA